MVSLIYDDDFKFQFFKLNDSYFKVCATLMMIISWSHKSFHKKPMGEI